jgi:lysophospholipase L1-like esterase
VSSKWRFVAVALLGISVSLNVALCRLGLALYRDGIEVRVDPTREVRFRQLNGELAAPTPGVARIVYIGDSRIERWPALPRSLGVESINRGSGGETTAQMALRIERDVVALHPAVAVVESGINDLKGIGGVALPQEEIVAGCERNLCAVVDRLHHNGIQVVLLTILPVGPVEIWRRPIWSDDILAATSRVNATIRSLRRPGVMVVDCDPGMMDKGRMKSAYASDTFHLTPEGYDALERIVAPALKASLADRIRECQSKPGETAALSGDSRGLGR